MSDILGFGADLSWWAWTLFVLGAVAVVAVIGALFLPDWRRADFTGGLEAEPGTNEFVQWAAATLNVPVYEGGTVELLQNGDAFFPAILDAIRGARESVHFEVYIFEPDEIGRQFMEAFKERARSGVDVRLVLDGVGAYKMRKRHRDELRDAGVTVGRFRPLSPRNLVRMYRRTHRRSIIIDGRVAFTGGAAVSAKWKGAVRNEHEWRDSMTRVTGPAVAGIQATFAGTWLYCTGEVLAGARFFPDLARGDGPRTLAVASSPSDSAQPIRLLFWLTFSSARERLWISSSYFIPDRRLRQAVIERARAGVDVRILVPGTHTDAVPVQAAGRTYYDELLSAGVRIFEYEPSMMHAKTVVVDSTWSLVGSANLDERSMEINEENLLGISDDAFAREIEAGFAADLERSCGIGLEKWRTRSLASRVFERACKGLIEQY